MVALLLAAIAFTPVARAGFKMDAECITKELAALTDETIVGVVAYGLKYNTWNQDLEFTVRFHDSVGPTEYQCVVEFARFETGHQDALFFCPKIKKEKKEKHVLPLKGDAPQTALLPGHCFVD